MSFFYTKNQAKKFSDVGILHRLECKICLHKGSYIRTDLIDTNKSTIDQIVNRKIQCNVLSQNEITKELEWKPIKNWYRNTAKDQQWVQLKLENSRNNSKGIVCTPDHEIITTEGRIIAQDIKPNYHKVIIDEPKISDEQLGALIGTILGDGGLYKKRLSYFKCRQTNKALIDFKIKLFDNLGAYFKETSTKIVNHAYRKPVYVCIIPNSYQIDDLYNLIVIKTKFKSFNSYRSPQKVLDYLNPIGLALWYMDDGFIKRNLSKTDYNVKQYACICLKGFTKEDQQLIATWFRNYLSCEDKTNQYHNKGGVSICDYNETLCFDGETTRKFWRIVGPFIIPEFRYKVDKETPDFNPNFKINKLNIPHSIFIKSKEIYKSKSETRYCIEVEDNHNFFTSSGLVSNCPLYNLSSNRNKDIAPQGPIKEGGIYILGQGPGKEEDQQGKFFVGRSGELLQSCFTPEQWKEFRINNITRTRTPNDEEPTYESIECCRPSIERDIALVKPKIIFGFGGPALKWVLPNKSGNQDPSIMAWRGHPFPVTIAGHTCWYYPIYHPAYVLRNSFLEHVFKLDIENALKFTQRNLPAVVEDLTKVRENTEILTDIPSIRTAFQKLKTRKYAVGDLETNQARPYYTDSIILTMAWGDYDWCFAFPWNHPQAKWTPEEFAELRSIVFDFLCFNIKKIAHNTAFELEWLIFEFGLEIIKGPLRALWEDTQCAAYVLGFGGGEKRSGDSGEFEEVSRVQRGLLSLDNLTQAYLGFFLKSISKVNRARLIKEDLQKVMLYGILDPKYTARIYDLLMKDLEYNKLMAVYKEQCRRVPTAVLTQQQGLVYNPEQAEIFLKEYTDKLTAKTKEVLQHPSITEYRTKFGGFNITTPADVAGLFKYLGFNTEDKEGKSKSGKDILSLIDHPLARGIETIRETGKIISTYIEPFITKDIIFPDGKLHTQFTTMFTTTGRLSSLDPNVQNFPKRANKQIRKIIVAPKNHIMVSLDYGQIEARVIAMLSKDKYFVNALKNNLDVHAEWSEILAKLYPKRIGGNVEKFLQNKALFKAFRDIVKNKWVFPLFFGASVKSSAGYMGIPYEIANEAHKLFWGPKYFQGIKSWQEELYDFYHKKGYVENPTGRRRYMYMQGGEIINFPVQSFAADIMMDSMNRLSEYAINSNNKDYEPVISLHDDLTFYLKCDTYKEDLDFIAKQMLTPKFEIINVPLTVEASTGPNWGELKEYKVFKSTDYV